MRDEGDSVDNDYSENSDGDDVAASGKKIHDSGRRNVKLLGKRKIAPNTAQDDKDDNDPELDAEDSNIINVCGLMIDIEKITK